MTTREKEQKTSQIRTQLVKILKPICPTVIWKFLRKITGRMDEYSPISYQGAQSPFFMSRLHIGNFSTIHEKWTELDTHINQDSNKTRLRVYTICSFAKLALNNTVEGALLTAGVSFGTSALISAEYLKLEKENRHYYLIDPLDGSHTATEKVVTTYAPYNTDFELVRNRWNSKIPTKWIRSFLSPESIENIPTLAFAHLNTGDYDAELICLPIVYQKLVPGGFIVQDLYGWQTEEKQNEIDSVLDTIGATSFLYITRQLIISKPINS
jgi:hypothetical protein